MWRVLLAAAPTNGPLEQSQSKLAKICYKDRNTNSANSLETLFWLIALKNPQIDCTKAINTIDKLRKYVVSEETLVLIFRITFN